MHDAGITHLGDTFIMAICFAALIVCFFLIACQICLAVIEYYLVVTLASLPHPLRHLAATPSSSPKRPSARRSPSPSS